MLSKSILVTLLSAYIASTGAAPISVTRRDVTVKSGDTCTSIASVAGTTPNAIIAANPSINAGCTNLAVGQVLVTGGGAPPAKGAAPPPPVGGSAVTAQQLLAVAPNSASCSGPASCRTAAQAAPLINFGFDKFGIQSKGEKAALISIMAFETGGFVFDTNQFPGRPGQGTRNLMLFPFILKYALETPEVAGQVGQIVPGLTENSSADVVNGVPPDKMNAIRALVLEDHLSFASAAWFLKTKCGPQFAADLSSGTQASYEAYLTGCVGTTVTADRLAGFTKAIGAL